MKIVRNDRREPIRLEELRPGESFLWKDELYVKATFGGMDTHRIVMRMCDGVLIENMSPDTLVYLCYAKIVVE